MTDIAGIGYKNRTNERRAEMERLTKRNECGDAYYPECYERCYGEGVSEKCNDCDYDEKICDALAAYEDTGLTPEQIMELKDRDTAKAPEVFDGHWYKCPTCGMYAGGIKGEFCHRCGQRLKWED